MKDRRVLEDTIALISMIQEAEDLAKLLSKPEVKNIITESLTMYKTNLNLILDTVKQIAGE